MGAARSEGGAMQDGYRLAGAGAAGDLRGARVTGVVGDLALVRVEEGAPGRERVGEDEPQFLRAGYVGVRLVVREDRDQAVRVSGRGGEDDAAPVVVQRHDAELVVMGVLGCLEVLGRVRVPGEGGDRLVDGALDGLVELTLR
jgi:hypothetical protein